MTTAFSREESNGDGSRFYVQDQLRAHAARLSHLLTKEGACFYVAGNSRGMPDAVRAAVVEALQSDGQMSAAVAETFVQELERRGRYQSETWA